MNNNDREYIDICSLLNTMSTNADLITVEAIHAKLKEGYGDIENGNVHDAAAAFQRFQDTHKL